MQVWSAAGIPSGGEVREGPDVLGIVGNGQKNSSGFQVFKFLEETG